MGIKKIILTISFLFSSIILFGQGFSYTFTDPCTYKKKQLFIDNPNGNVALIYNGQIKSFTATDLQLGALESWVNQVNSSSPAGTGPCGGVGLAQNTTVNATVASNNIAVLTTVLSALSSVSSVGNIGGGSALEGVVESGEKSASSGQKDEDKSDNKTDNGSNNDGGSSSTSDNNQGQNSSGGGTGGNSGSEGQTNSGKSGESSSSDNSAQGGGKSSESSVGGDKKTEEQKMSESRSEQAKSSTQTKSKVAQVKQGSLMLTGDIVAISSATGNDPQQFKLNASVIKSNTENNMAKGFLLNYTTRANNTCFTFFYSYKTNKFTTIFANSSMMNFEKDFFNTMSIMESYKLGKFTFTLGENITKGNLGDAKFKSLSTLGGCVGNFTINKKINTSVMFVMVYSPFVYYYEGIWYKSGLLAVPFAAIDYKITKKFKFNISFSGVQQINSGALNYQILMGAKALL
jgi:hypothetical protein